MMPAPLSAQSFMLVREALTRAPKHPVADTGTNYLLRALDDPALDQWDEVRAFTASAGLRKDFSRAAGYAMSVAGGTDVGASWSASAERIGSPAPDSPVIEDLREAAWSVHRAGTTFTPWTDGFLSAVERASLRAAERGSRIADLRDVTLALFETAPNRVVESLSYRPSGSILERAEQSVSGGGIAAALTPLSAGELDAFTARIEAASLPADTVWAPGLAELQQTAILDDATPRRGLFGRPKKAAPLGPVIAHEALRQAVRAAAEQVETTHLTRALRVLGEQAVAAGHRWSALRPESLAPDTATEVSDVAIPVTWPRDDSEILRAVSATENLDEVIALLR